MAGGGERLGRWRRFLCGSSRFQCRSLIQSSLSCRAPTGPSLSLAPPCRRFCDPSSRLSRAAPRAAVQSVCLRSCSFSPPARPHRRRRRPRLPAAGPSPLPREQLTRRKRSFEVPICRAARRRASSSSGERTKRPIASCGTASTRPGRLGAVGNELHLHNRARSATHGLVRRRQVLLFRGQLIGPAAGRGGQRSFRRHRSRPRHGEADANLGHRRFRHRQQECQSRPGCLSQFHRAHATRTSGSCWATTPMTTEPTMSTRGRFSIPTRRCCPGPCSGRPSETMAAAHPTPPPKVVPITTSFPFLATAKPAESPPGQKPITPSTTGICTSFA